MFWVVWYMVTSVWARMALPCSHGIARHHFSCFFASFHRDQVALANMQQSFSFADIVKLYVQQSRIESEHFSFHSRRQHWLSTCIRIKSNGQCERLYLSNIFHFHHIRCHSDNAIAYQVERHISLQIRSSRLVSTKFTLQMHMHSNKETYSMISINARSRNQCASMNRVERQSLSLTLVDDILQPMIHHHMASYSTNMALLWTPMTSQNAHSAAHHSTQTLLAQRQCIRVALAGLQHSSLQASTVKMNPRWSPTRCRHAAFELELGKCNRHDDSIQWNHWCGHLLLSIVFHFHQIRCQSGHAALHQRQRHAFGQRRSGRLDWIKSTLEAHMHSLKLSIWMISTDL